MDGEGGAGAAELTGGEGGGDGTGTVTTQPWLAAIEGIPDDLKSDAVLNRYDSVEKALRGHVEARQLASSRLAVPGKDAKPEDWGKVFDALGRPKTAAEYDFGLPALPDDADDAAKTARSEMTGRYAELFHPLGLNGEQAKALVAADIKRIETAVAAHNEASKAGRDALKAEMGADYAPQLEAASKLYKQLFPDSNFADAFDDHLGSRALLEGFMKLAKVAGEHPRVDGRGGELTDANNPQAQLDAKNQDAAWRAKYKAGDQATVAEYNRLLAAATAKAVAN